VAANTGVCVDRRGAIQAWASGITQGRTIEHLRISEVGAGLTDDVELEFAADPIRLPAPVATSTKGAKYAVMRDEGHRADDIEQSYQNSLRTIDSHIYGMAAAITSLDVIEHSLSKARTSIETLRSRGEPINVQKAETTLLNLADQINMAVRRIDLHDVNLMRDTRIELRVMELDTDGTRTMGFDLTLISLEKLLAFKLKSSPMSSDQLCGLIDALQHTVNSNLHILSSMVLMMFASRDYTDDVQRLIMTDHLLPDPARRPNPAVRPLQQQPIELASDVVNLGAARAAATAANAAANGNDPWRKSLMTLLETTHAKAAAE
jgi:hypothetical protein